MKTYRYLILAPVILLSAGCTNLDETFDAQIDSAATQLKQSIRKVEVDKKIEETKKRIADDPDFRQAGESAKKGVESAKKGVEQLDDFLSRWLDDPPATEPQDKPKQ